MMDDEIDKILNKYLPIIKNNPSLEDEMYQELHSRLDYLLIERSITHPIMSLFTNNWFSIRYIKLIYIKTKEFNRKKGGF